MGPISSILRILTVWLALHASHVSAGFPNVVATGGEPWPAPQQVMFSKTTYDINPAMIRFNVTKYFCRDLTAALDRAYERLHQIVLWHMDDLNKEVSAERTNFQRTDISGFTGNIEVQLMGKCERGSLPSANDDEQYLIKINTSDFTDRAAIIANTIWGMYHGLETFTQLIYYSIKEKTFRLRTGIIRDFPRFPYRGLLLDTSRHYLSVDTIKYNLDLMAENKLNVFHWHIVDDPSFPFVSTKFPSLSRLGAFKPSMIYTVQDVTDIIEYARQRGIRVIPEFDTPGHTRSWGPAIPGLLTKCFNVSTEIPTGEFGPVDPTSERNFKFLEQFFTEVTTRFPDSFIHLGGDEVKFGFDCWLSNPTVKKWMVMMNISSPQEIEGHYVQRLLNLVEGLTTKPNYIIWQDVLDNNISVHRDSVVHVWKAGWQREMARVTAAGYRAILSSCWYLNYIHYGIDWPSLYECEPLEFPGSQRHSRLVIGGEACMWGEYVDDTNVMARTWPRASVVAERLWSARTVNSSEKARSRLEEHRCRLLKQGYSVEPINGPGYC